MRRSSGVLALAAMMLVGILLKPESAFSQDTEPLPRVFARQNDIIELQDVVINGLSAFASSSVTMENSQITSTVLVADESTVSLFDTDVALSVRVEDMASFTFHGGEITWDLTVRPEASATITNATIKGRVGVSSPQVTIEDSYLLGGFGTSQTQDLFGSQVFESLGVHGEAQVDLYASAFLLDGVPITPTTLTQEYDGVLTAVYNGATANLDYGQSIDAALTLHALDQPPIPSTTFADGQTHIVEGPNVLDGIVRVRDNPDGAPTQLQLQPETRISRYLQVEGHSRVELAGDVTESVYVRDAASVSLQGAMIGDDLLVRDSARVRMLGGSVAGELYVTDQAILDVMGGTVTEIAHIKKRGTLNVISGHFMDRLDVDSGTLNVLGGDINSHIEAKGQSTVMIAGGRFLESLHFWDSAQLIITGGEFHDYIDINPGSVEAWISGGAFEEEVGAENGDRMTITGGHFRDRVTSRGSAVVNIFGGDFLSTLGSIVSGEINIFGGQIRGGIGSDGGMNVNVYAQSFLIDGRRIEPPTDFAAHWITAVYSDGSIDTFRSPSTSFDGGGFNLIRLDPSTAEMVTIDDGSNRRYADAAVSSYDLMIRDSAAGTPTRIDLGENATVGGHLVIEESSRATLSGGDVAATVALNDQSRLTLRDGRVSGDIVAYDFTLAEILGGEIHGDLLLDDQAWVVLYGDEFMLDGEPLDYGLVPLTAQIPALVTGTLADGTPISVEVESRPLKFTDRNMCTSSRCSSGRRRGGRSNPEPEVPLSGPSRLRQWGLYIFPLVPGELDGSGTVDAFDVGLFEQALADPEAFMAEFGFVNPHVLGDINNDGHFDAFDVDHFEALLAGGGATAPEPTTAIGFLVLLLSVGRRSAVRDSLPPRVTATK